MLREGRLFRVFVHFDGVGFEFRCEGDVRLDQLADNEHAADKSTAEVEKGSSGGIRRQAAG
jgi:hypothetical protein